MALRQRKSKRNLSLCNKEIANHPSVSVTTRSNLPNSRSRRCTQRISDNSATEDASTSISMSAEHSVQDITAFETSQLRRSKRHRVLQKDISRQMHPQVQQMQKIKQMQPISQSKNVPFQQKQQIERMIRRQPSSPRAGMDMVQDRLMVQVKIEAPSELPMDSNAFNSFNNRHPQLQFRQQQIPAMSNPKMQNVPVQSGNQFRQMSSSQIAQIQSQNAGVLRARPVKVEGFQELMGGDASSKHGSDENRLTSPK